MAEFTARRMVTIVNPQGLHARPADLFVRLANQFESAIGVRKGNETVDGKSILSILTLAATEGTELEIQANGSDAEAALEALCSLVEHGFARDEESAGGDGTAGHDRAGQISDWSTG
jgi:phosphotransferase system HPr (HPr) family protein